MMTYPKSSRVTFGTPAVKAAIFILAFIGLVLIVPRPFASVTWLRLAPFPKVNYLTSARFLTCSFGLFAILKRWQWASLLSGVFVCFFVLAKLLAFEGSFSFGALTDLDLVRRSTSSILGGRAVGFFLGGCSLILLSSIAIREKFSGSLGFLGVLIVQFSFLSFFTFSLEPERFSPLALGSTLGLLLFGIAVINLTWFQCDDFKIKISNWAPWAFGSAILFVTIGLHKVLKVQETSAFTQKNQTELNEVISEIQRRMELRIEALDRLAQHWNIWGRPVREVWESDALIYIKGHRGYQSLAWVDQKYFLRWLVPVVGNELSVDSNMRSESRRYGGMRLAREQRRITITRPINLIEGGSGFEVCIPLFHNENFEGFIISAFRYKELFDMLLHSDLARGYVVSIYDGNEPIYERKNSASEGVNKWAQTGTAKIIDAEWKITVWPSPKKIDSEISWLPRGILIIGILLAMLSGLVIYLIQLGGRRRQEAECKHHLEVQLNAKVAGEKRLRGLLEATPDAILFFDKNNLIVSANGEAENLLQCSREKIIGLSLTQFIDEKSLTARSKVKERILSYTQISRLDATFFSAQVTCSFVEVAEENLGMVAIRDVTRQKEQEEDLARSNEELERFAYVASHDLQEPLRMVVSYLDLLNKRYGSKLDQEADEYITFARNGAKRMRQLIEDLLTLSRISPKRSQNITEIPLGEAVGPALENLKVAIDESKAEIVVNHLPPVMGDQMQFTQLFQNLIGNALKYRVAAPPKIEISAERDAMNWVISVKDNGIGFEMKFSDRIFAVFQRLHGREQYSGNGVGLAICKRIVERHGGKIWARSEPGKGSTFYFTLVAANLVG
jgi:PAS domain S-box-containing protein